MTRRLISASIIFVFSLFFSFAQGNIEVTRMPERFFWKISGTDAEGKPSAVYIQGTIHVGTEEIYPLEDGVIEIFDSADRHVSEIASDEIDKMYSMIQTEMLTSFSKADGKLVLDSLEEKEAEALNTLLGSEAVALLNRFEPWVLNAAIEGMVISSAGFDPLLGLDMWFYARLASLGKKTTGLDTLRTQLDIVEYGTYEEQVELLKDTLSQIMDPEKTRAELEELYNAYLSNDEERMVAAAQLENLKYSEINEEFYNAYYEKMLTDRNKSWAEQIKQFLKEGGTTFIFAGTAHFTGEDSVFSCLK